MWGIFPLFYWVKILRVLNHPNISKDNRKDTEQIYINEGIYTYEKS